MSALCPCTLCQAFSPAETHKQRNKPKHNEDAESDLIFEKVTAL